MPNFMERPEFHDNKRERDANTIGATRRGKRYLVTDTYTVSGNGEPTTERGRLDGEVVDGDYVLSFTSVDIRRFLINLGGSESYQKSKTGIITCRSISPDRLTTRVVRFTPVKD